MTLKEKLETKLTELTDILISNEETIKELDEDSDEYQDLKESIDDMKDELMSIESELRNIERGEYKKAAPEEYEKYVEPEWIPEEDTNESPRLAVTKYKVDVRDFNASYQDIVTDCKARNLHKFACYPDSLDSDFIKDMPQYVEIELEHLYETQFNTKCGRRVHEWEEPIFPNENLRRGYYLHITKAFRELMLDYSKCGYCGKQYYKAGIKYCNSCFDSEYLEENNYLLLALKPVSFKGPRDELTPGEYKYIDDEVAKGRTKRVYALRVEETDEVHQNYARGNRTADSEKKIMLWLISNGISTRSACYHARDNTVSMNYMGRWNKREKADILEKLKDAPFKYTLPKEDK